MRQLINLRILIPILLLGGLLIQIPDLFTSSDFIYQRIHITSNTIIFLCITLAAICRIISRKLVLPFKINHLLFFFFLITFLSTIVMTVLDTIHYVNYVYSLTKVNYDQVGFLSFSLFSIWLLNQKNTFFHKYKKLIIFLVPLAIFFIFVSMYFWPFEVLKKSLAEDGQVESIQVLFLLISVILASISAKKLKNKKYHILSILYILLAIGLFFIAGEEISWGQRILGIATPESLQTLNRQNEITLHNIYGIEGRFMVMQIIVNIVGAFGFVLIPILSKIIKKNILSYLIPRYYYILYFIPTPLFYLTDIKVIIPYVPEVVELFFYTGIMVFLLENYFSLQKSTKLNKKTANTK